MATMTLGQFERDYGINRGTVQKQAQAMGFKTSGGLGDDALGALQAYYKVGPYAPAQRPQQPETTSSELVVIDGDGAGIETPEMQVYKFAMPDVLAESFEDPMALATQFLEFSDQLITALDLKTAKLEKRAEDTRTAAQLIERKTRNIASKQRTAEIKEAVTTAFIERDMAEIKHRTGVS